jgi:hypothetical protein
MCVTFRVYFVCRSTVPTVTNGKRSISAIFLFNGSVTNLVEMRIAPVKRMEKALSVQIVSTNDNSTR